MSRTSVSGRNAVSGRQMTSGRQSLAVGDRLPEWVPEDPELWIEHARDQDLPSAGSGDASPDILPPYSGASADQGTTSNQPTNRADHWEFGGDDFWTVTGIADDLDTFSIVVVADMSTVSQVHRFAGAALSGGQPFYGLRYNDSLDKFFGDVKDSDGNFSVASTVSVGASTGETFVAGMSVSLQNPRRTEVVVRGFGTSNAQTDTDSLTGDLQIDTRELGRFRGDTPHTGKLYEEYWWTTALTQSQLQTLGDDLATKHGVSF